MQSPFLSLRAKLLATTLTFLIVLGIALALLVTLGFQQTQQHAALHSGEGLQTQGREALQGLITREAELSALYFQQPAIASRTVAAYLGTVLAQDSSDTVSPPLQVIRFPDGHLEDPSPTRLSDIFVPNTVPPSDTAIAQVISRSALLDNLGPPLLQETPQAVALYYVSPQGLTRYYPRDTLKGVPPDWDVTQEPWFLPTAPQANPERRTTWSALYLDDVGNGLMTTTCTPIYTDTTFAGVACLDVTLQELVEHLNEVKLTPTSYAFLTDSAGRLVAGPPRAIQQLTGQPRIPEPEGNATIGLDLIDPAIAAGVQAATGEIQTIQLGAEMVLLAVVPLPDLGWRLGIVTPISEVTAQSRDVVAAIEAGTSSTLRWTMLTMGGFLVLAIAGATLFSVRLTRPIADMVKATKAIARGDLNITLPGNTTGELGVLAHAFNLMTRELVSTRAHLEGSKANLEQLVAERTSALRQEMEERARLQSTVVQQAETLLGLSTPLIPVHDDILVMPLVGTLDSARMGQILHTLLRGVEAQHARAVIVDITGVSVVDTYVAQALVQAAQAVRLLGAHVILTGIRPEVAQALVGLDLNVSTLITRSTLQSGIATATHLVSRPIQP